VTPAPGNVNPPTTPKRRFSAEGPEPSLTDAPDSGTDAPTLRHGVVVACTRGDGRWLIVRRADHLERAPGRVGFPGGIIEPGETHQQAVVREMAEELTLTVTPTCKFWERQGDVPGFLLHGWLADVDDFDTLRPDPAEVAEVLWLTPHEAVNHPLAFKGNADYIAALRSI